MVIDSSLLTRLDGVSKFWISSCKSYPMFLFVLEILCWKYTYSREEVDYEPPYTGEEEDWTITDQNPQYAQFTAEQLHVLIAGAVVAAAQQGRGRELWWRKWWGSSCSRKPATTMHPGKRQNKEMSGLLGLADTNLDKDGYIRWNARPELTAFCKNKSE